MDRLGAYAPGRAPSVMENGLGRIFDRYNLKRPVAEYVARPHGEFRIDFAYPEVRLGVEGQSLAWHSNARQQEADHERRNALAEYGWTLLEFGWRVIRYRPDAVARRIEAVYARLAAAF